MHSEGDKNGKHLECDIYMERTRKRGSEFERKQGDTIWKRLKGDKGSGEWWDDTFIFKKLLPCEFNSLPLNSQDVS